MSGFENECKLSDYADCLPMMDDNQRLLFIGGFRSAVSWKLLQEAGITHIVNCTTKVDNIHERYFEYYKIPVDDDTTANLLRYFDAATAFMEQATGNVLVHCMAGQSRSAAIVIAYLIRYHGCSRNEAIQRLQCHHADIRPNRGFLRQLSLYEWYQSPPEKLRNDYYDMEWGREALEFYETFGLPDVDARFADRILPIVLGMRTQRPILQAVWTALIDPTLFYLQHRHEPMLRPSIRTSKSF